MQLNDILNVVNSLGTEGIKSLPLKTLLAFPQARNVLPESVLLTLEQLGAHATVGDIPSDAWVAIALAGSTKFVSGELASTANQNPVTTEDEGRLIICRSCNKPHWYGNHAVVTRG